MADRAITVGELMDLLVHYPPELEVFVEGYEGGLRPLRKRWIKQARIKKNVNQEWYFGPHEEGKDGEDQGLILPR